MDEALLDKLEERLGPASAARRLGVERDHEAQIFGRGINFFHIRNTLKVMGLYWHGRRNTERIKVLHNDVISRKTST